MKNDELFEALTELDDKLIAKAKHIDTYGEQTVVLRRTPAWKIITGWVAAAACVAALAVGGVFGMKYINGKNDVVSVPNAADTANTANTSWAVSDCKMYAPAEYPEEAKYVYSGDFSELTKFQYGIVDRIVYDDLITLEEESDLIVFGEFVDDPHQCTPPEDTSYYDGTISYSYNKLKIDRVVKGDRVEGEEIIICGNGIVHDGNFYYLCCFMPMIKGDKWIYFLGWNGEENNYYPIGFEEARYPVPGFEDYALDKGVYGGYKQSIYEDIKKRLPDWKYEVYFESEYPDNAEVYGDYSGLEIVVPDNSYGEWTASYDEMFNEKYGCEYIVSGEFIDDTHQWYKKSYGDYVGKSYNKFRIDKVYKGDIEEGQVVMIEQNGFAADGKYYVSDNLTPMIKGDKWLYCLSKHGGICSARNYGNGRYPLPGSQNKSLEFGEYGVINSQYANTKMYERLLTELGITGMSVSENFDGVVLSVMLEDSKFDVKDDIRVKAIVRNTTDKPIGLLMPVTGEDTHTEITTFISHSNLCELVDVSAANNADMAESSRIIQPGEEYVQEMTFRTAAMVHGMFDGTTPPAPEIETGVYKGTATIRLLSDPNDTMSEVTERKVEFSLYITDNSADVTDKPKSEVIFDQLNKEYVLKDGSVQFTMPEFEGAEFECDTSGVYMNGEVLYSGTPVYNLYLCDINMNGIRELVSCVNTGEEEYIKVCDVANGKIWNQLRDGRVLSLDGRGDLSIVKHYTDDSHNKVVYSEVLTFLKLLENFTLEGDNTSVVFDLLDEESVENQTFRFTMPEFEGAEFECNLYGVYMNGETLYGGSFIHSIYLSDLNGDGKREIISTVNYYASGGEYGIKVCDVANGGKLWYLRGYTVAWQDWVLMAVPRSASDHIRALTFDLLTEYPEPEEPVNKPVKNYGEFEDLSRVQGHEDKFRFFYKYKNAPENEPVYSTVNGEVVEVSENKWNSGYGNYVAVLGNDGFYYYYSSLDGVAAAVGDKVTAGTKIGTVGSSARWYIKDGLGVRYTCSEDPLDLSDAE
ncbi:MAG: M23 family metallopeptidase [Ruminococcaceae bacterium]|nr:M23 family metallopeptidase [Oscillospiraceae bacterium]